MDELTPDKSPAPGTLAHCAKTIGVSAPYLSKLKKQGRITPAADGRWYPDEVRAQMNGTADPGAMLATLARQQYASTAQQDQHSAASLPPDVDRRSVDEIDALYGPDHKENLLIARSLRERELAAQERIKRLEAEGKLCLVEDVERQAYTQGRLLRDAVMRAAAKISPVIAPITDAWELEKLLANALRTALESVAEQEAPSAVL